MRTYSQLFNALDLTVTLSVRRRSGKYDVRYASQYRMSATHVRKQEKLTCPFFCRRAASFSIENDFQAEDVIRFWGKPQYSRLVFD